MITVIGIILSTFLISDFFLPHHFQKVEITHFNLKPGASGVNGEVLGRIKTKNEGSFWVTRMDHDLYGKSYPTYLESSWFFHNPIKLVSIGKTKIKSYDLHFGFYNFSGLMILFLLLPLTLFFYKKKKISFTVLYHFCYYFVGILILLFVLTGYRWAHIITLGFL